MLNALYLKKVHNTKNIVFRFIISFVSKIGMITNTDYNFSVIKRKSFNLWTLKNYHRTNNK